MATEPKNVKDIFLAAVEKANPGERALYLDEACAGEAELRQRVESLLKAHDEPGSFLDKPAVEFGPIEGLPTTEDESKSEPLGTVIGPYKLLQQLGEGGMGTVYMAQQTEPVKRLVALKIIKAGMDSAEVLARFEQERQALAVMDHPNIAKVLDAGTTCEPGCVSAGRPYFVMELVKGIPITKYCDQEHLSPKERLELFIPVCQAVQHAHQKGIIHRDLKPSNVIIALYDGRPVPKVIDFGVAKATGPKLTEQTMFTEVGRILGTLEYMAPEQAEINNLDIDTRADIYSLGVMLYELLTGSPPFTKQQLRSAAFDEMLRIIREVEPHKPSTKLSSSNDLPSIAAKRKVEPKRLCKLVHGDLDWIVMKALEKDRGRRYETANGFAMDIQRYLADQPVLAGPPSAGYRARKLLRRNRGPVIAASAIVVLLVGGIVGTTWALLRALNAEHAAKLAADAAKEAQQAEAAQRSIADDQRQEAEKSQQEAKTEAANAKRAAEEAKAVLDFFEKQVLSSTRPEGEEGGLGKDVTIRKAVDAAEPKIGETFKDSPLIEASVRNVLGMTYYYLGEPALAIQQLEQARSKQQINRGPDHPDTLRSMNNLAVAYHAAGKDELAISLHEQAVAAMKVKLGPDHDDTLAFMVNLASTYQATGKLGLAIPLFEVTVAANKKKFGPDHPSTIRSMSYLALAYRSAGKPDLALPLFEQTAAAHKAKLGPEHPATLASMNNLALGYQDAGKLDLALPLIEETMTIMKEKLGPNHPNTLHAKETLAAIYRDVGKLDMALLLLEETLAASKLNLGPEHPDTLRTMKSLAAAYGDVGKLDLAVQLLEQSLSAMKAKLGPDHPSTLITTKDLASSYLQASKLDLALPLLQQTVVAMKAKLGPEHPMTLEAVSSLASAYRAAGSLDMAFPLLEESLATKRQKLGPDHPDTLRSMNNLAAAYWSARKLDRSIPLFEETLELYVKKLGKDHPETLRTMANLGVNYSDAGRLNEAIPLLEEALDRANKLKPFPVHLDFIRPALVETFNRAGMFAKSEPFYRNTYERAKQKFGADHFRTAGALALLGSNLLEQKKYTDAEPTLRECLAIREKKEPNAWTTFNTKSMLGEAFLGQKKYAEAEPLLLQGYEGIKQRQGEPGASATRGTGKTLGTKGLGSEKGENPDEKKSGTSKTEGFARPARPAMPPERLIEALDRLVQLYEATGNKDEAAKWRAKLEEAKTKKP